LLQADDIIKFLKNLGRLLAKTLRDAPPFGDRQSNCLENLLKSDHKEGLKSVKTQISGAECALL
jgi:hypothetical protein